MKIRIIALTVLVIATIFVIAQSLPISQFPNVSTPLDSDLFVLAQTQAPKTNKNIRYDQLRGAIRSGMATETFVNTVSNILAANAGFARLEVQTNTVRLGLVTNLNWTYGVTGSVSGTTAILGVDDSLSLSNLSNSISTTITVTSNFLATSSIDVKTNQTMIVLQGTPVAGSQWYVGTNGTPTTNEARSGLEFNAFWRSLRMGQVAGGADINGVVGNGSNYWNNTNIGPLTVGFGTNPYVKGAYSSVLGGSGNAITTNCNHATIGGGVDNLIDIFAPSSFIGGGGGNKIRPVGAAAADVGSATIAGGSNNVITGTATLNASIGGGGDNHIDSAKEASISGGFGNQVEKDARYAYIGGGFNNTAGNTAASADESTACVMVGGQQNQSQGDHSFVGGGLQNGIVARNSDKSTVAGGQGNTIGTSPATSTTFAFIGGGFDNDIAGGADFSVVDGGADNDIAASSTNGWIGGGRFNNISASRVFANIPGGERNTVGGNHSWASGDSNQITGHFSHGIGQNITNAEDRRILLGAFDRTHKTVIVGATNATVGGLIISVTTPVASAGAAETNLIAVTIPAHTLTNLHDKLTFRASGRFAATANAKDIKVVYGSETILDTTSQIVNSGAWTFEGEISRTGNTSQSVNAEFHGAGVTLFTTASSLDLAQTNGINTTLKLTSTAAGDGDVTNRSLTVWKWVAP